MKVQVLPGMAEEVRKPAMPAWLTKTVAALLILVCLCGIGTSIGVNAVNRSLWLDEAMLADSFSNRTLANLWDGAFDNKQIEVKTYGCLIRYFWKKMSGQRA